MIRIRNILAQVFESRGRVRHYGYAFDAILVALILANVIAIVIESVPSVAKQHIGFFAYFELISVSIFTLEYLARLWASVDLERFENSTLSDTQRRLRYLCSPMAIIDLLAILPSLLVFFVSFDLRFLRVLRLLRIFKLTRYSRAMQLLLQTIREESGSLFAAFSIMAVILIVAASGIYLLEHDVQPDKFGSIPKAMWWALITLTTVGYGDVVPITGLGKVFGGIITILSMGMVAIPTGLLASSFSDQLRQRRDRYSETAYQLMEDGVICVDDREHLDELRVELGLSKQECAQIEQQVREKHPLKRFCPHCGHHLN
ncbi:ion transporter [Pseudoalteromonas ruthenica]|uniref:ion transporter n=1 Tax=Pseudoalteromonas ruthenica TaxID=151081 RepID=UPI000345916D|nr:ion transporter [Pseudoalteromonas ruthenica]